MNTTAFPPPRLNIAQILTPASVAVFGASDDLTKFGGRIIHYLLNNGFGGRIVPINLNRSVVAGLPAVPDIGSAGPIDVAILAVPAHSVEAMIEKCADAGVGACVIVTAGFSEAGDDGAVLQQRIVRTARMAGMRLIGPNCMGIINPSHQMALTSSVVVESGELIAGNVGLISQSGALMVSMYDRALREQIYFSVCLSLGNQSDLEICDFFEHLIHDPKTHVITMYVEGFVDAKRFACLAKRASDAGKPVIVTKTGRTAAGVQAARSHTASLAGSYKALEAVCKANGVILTDDPDGMLQLAAIFSRFGRSKAKGVGIISPSGGAIGIGVDRMTDVGVRLGSLDQASAQLLATAMNASHAFNPIDLGNRMRDDLTTVETIVDAFTLAPDVGMLFVILTTSPNFDNVTRALANAAVRGGKPVLFVVTPGAVADNSRRILQDLKVPFVDRMDDAIRILRHYMPQATSLCLQAEASTRPADLPDPRSTADALPSGAMSEPQVKTLLASYGIPFPAEQMCTSEDQAVASANEIGYPVAMKAVCAQLVHKSDVGAVKLGLSSDDQVRRAWREISESISLKVPHGHLDGCLVAEMVTAQSELIVGAVNDEQFGPLILVGFGGTTVELMPDTQLAPAPVNREGALAMLKALKQWPLLDGYRGTRKADADAIADVISRVSWLAVDLESRIAELDVNPLLIRAADGSPVGVDARAAMLLA
jgi:acyl-CoA synthetase (NDP forming)